MIIRLSGKNLEVERPKKKPTDRPGAAQISQSPRHVDLLTQSKPEEGIRRTMD